MHGHHQEGYESEWNRGEAYLGSGKLAPSDRTGYPLRIWPAKVSKVGIKNMYSAAAVNFQISISSHVNNINDNHNH